MNVDAHGTGATSNLNGVLESGETVVVGPVWQNGTSVTLTFSGSASGLTGPTGPNYGIADAVADYGSAVAGATTDCYTATRGARLLLDDRLRLASGCRTGTRSSTRRSASAARRRAGRSTSARASPTCPRRTVLQVHREHLPQRHHRRLRRGDLLPDELGHARADGGLPAEGEARRRPTCRRRARASSPTCPARASSPTGSRSSPPKASPAAAAAANYCPANPVTRAQMAVFLLKAKHGSAYAPPRLHRHLHRRAVPEPVRRLDRGALRRRDHRRLRRRHLLPERSEHARPDGRLPRSRRSGCCSTDRSEELSNPKQNGPACAGPRQHLRIRWADLPRLSRVG